MWKSSDQSKRLIDKMKPSFPTFIDAINDKVLINIKNDDVNKLYGLTFDGYAKVLIPIGTCDRQSTLRGSLDTPPNVMR